jgi:hypothetical protein
MKHISVNTTIEKRASVWPSSLKLCLMLTALFQVTETSAQKLRASEEANEVVPSRVLRPALHVLSQLDPGQGVRVPTSIDEATLVFAATLDRRALRLIRALVPDAWRRKQVLGLTAPELAIEIRRQFAARSMTAGLDTENYLEDFTRSIERDWQLTVQDQPMWAPGGSALRKRFLELRIVNPRHMTDFLIASLAYRHMRKSIGDPAVVAGFVVVDRPYAEPPTFDVQGCQSLLVPQGPYVWRETLGVDGGAAIYQVAICRPASRVWMFNESLGWFEAFGEQLRALCHARADSGRGDAGCAASLQ